MVCFQLFFAKNSFGDIPGNPLNSFKIAIFIITADAALFIPGDQIIFMEPAHDQWIGKWNITMQKALKDMSIIWMNDIKPKI